MAALQKNAMVRKGDSLLSKLGFTYDVCVVLGAGTF